MRKRRTFISHATRAAALGWGPVPLLAQSRAIRLVSMTDLSGVEKDSGNAISQGINAGVRAFNKSGGLFGTAIDYTPLDHQFSVERAKALTLQVESDPSCLGVVGLAGTAHTNAANDDAPALPIIGPISGASTLRKKAAPSAFWVRASYDDEVDRLVRHGAGLGLKSIGLVHSNDAFGKELLSAFSKTMSALQLTPAVLATTPAFTSAEIQDAVDKAAAARPQLLLVALAAMLPPFVKALRSRGVASTIYGLSIGASDANDRIVGRAGSGYRVQSRRASAIVAEVRIGAALSGGHASCRDDRAVRLLIGRLHLGSRCHRGHQTSGGIPDSTQPVGWPGVADES